MRNLRCFCHAATILLATGAHADIARAASCRSTLHREASAVLNDNRAPSGMVRDGMLRVALVARPVAWYPDGERGCSLLVHAFAEEGKPAEIPGPLVRVRAGAEVSVTVRNSLDVPIWVRGLQDRTSLVLDSTEIAPASSHEFRFRASAPGAWYYWAGAAGRTNAQFPMSTDDGQLVGALIVDPPTSPSPDRVFVMTRWTPRGVVGSGDYQLNAINGRSWPNTERLSYTAGDSVRWHVINASDELHMMHLHGFYYMVNDRGDAARGELLDAPKFWEIFEAAEALNVPIYLHPQAPPPAMVEPFLERGLEGAIWGFGAETGLHALAIIRSGVFDRFPKLRLVLGHGGEALPFWLYRLDYFSTHRPNTPKGVTNSLKRAPSEYIRENVYVTTSGMAWAPVITFLQSVLGMDRVLYAMDYPYQYEASEVAATDNVPISASDRKKLFQTNAEQLFAL